MAERQLPRELRRELSSILEPALGREGTGPAVEALLSGRIDPAAARHVVSALVAFPGDADPAAILRRILDTRDALIQRAQKRADGGWRYDPTPVGASDISVTVCQIMALRAARNVGVKVPREVITRAVDYVKRSCLADGSFCYMLQSRSSGPDGVIGVGFGHAKEGHDIRPGVVVGDFFHHPALRFYFSIDQ